VAADAQPAVTYTVMVLTEDVLLAAVQLAELHVCAAPVLSMTVCQQVSLVLGFGNGD
jgi:hypothetical protein